jgi:hypothetical protein
MSGSANKTEMHSSCSSCPLGAHLPRYRADNHHPRPRRPACFLRRRLFEQRQEGLADPDGPEIVDGRISLKVADREPIDETAGADAGVVDNRKQGALR